MVLVEGDSSGFLGVNRDDRDGGINHPIHVGTNGTNGNGAHLTGGGVWTNASSRQFKENLEPLVAKDILARIAKVPVDAREYKGTSERHIGPCAEDFHEQFDVGDLKDDGTREDRYLAAGDVAGVALVGVQELSRQLRDKTERIEQLEIQLTQMQALIETLLAQQSGPKGNSDELASNRK